MLRSAKDLGRVLGLAALSDPDDLDVWPEQWEIALRGAFPDECSHLVHGIGAGLALLLDDRDALDEARHALGTGLMAGITPTLDQLKVIGRQVQAFAIDPLVRRLS